MDATTAPRALRRPNVRALRLDAGALGTFALAFTLVLYLALKGGGYDPVVRSEVGIAVWWIVLLGSAVAVLPTASVGRRGIVALALLGGLCVWTALALSWTESSERTTAELARVVTHFGFLVLAIFATGRRSARYLVGGVGTAVTVVGAVALLSRLHPDWFPARVTGEYLPREANRLSYPLNYWNALAALVAIGSPAVLAAATRARHLVMQAVAAAALPMLALTAFLTLSRGGAAAVIVGTLVYLLLAPGRLATFATLVPVVLGSAVLIVATTQRDALQAAADSAAARTQGDELLVYVVLVCAGVALVQVAIGLIQHFVDPPSAVTRIRAHGRAFAAAGFVLVCLALVVAGAPKWAGDRWQEFKNPSLGLAQETGAKTARLTRASGDGRYQFWRSAVDANKTRPLTGRGPGTYEYWWARHGELPYFVRDAHSLYLQTLAESGWIGLLLLGGFLLFVVGAGTVRALREVVAERPWHAAATAGVIAFCLSVGVDWVWNLAVVAAACLILAAAVVAPGPRAEDRPRRVRLPHRIAAAVVSLVAIVAIAGPLLGASALHESTAAAARGNTGSALEHAASAGRAQPYAASPALQRAVLLESRGDFPAAVVAARAATTDEPTNWRTWFVLSRLEARNGSAKASLAAYRRARALNPRSLLFATAK